MCCGATQDSDAHSCWITHRLEFRYGAPVRDVSTRLRLMPPDARGGQRLVSYRLWADPAASSSTIQADDDGNRVHVIDVPHVPGRLTIAVELGIVLPALHTSGQQRCAPPLIDGLAASGGDRYRQPSPLATPDGALLAVAAAAIGRHAGPGAGEDAAGLAHSLCRLVSSEMRYARGTSTVHTTAAEAWAMRSGVCQDFSHVLLALCRAAGLTARYVSGFVADRDTVAMHAWVEVMSPSHLPGDSEPAGWAGWHGLDPTTGSWTDHRHVMVAVGRDYTDAKPIEGQFAGYSEVSLAHVSWVSERPRPFRACGDRYGCTASASDHHAGASASG